MPILNDDNLLICNQAFNNFRCIKASRNTTSSNRKTARHQQNRSSLIRKGTSMIVIKNPNMVKKQHIKAQDKEKK